MTINKLSGNRVLITLCGKDMRDFSLDFNTMSLENSNFRKVLLRITRVACRRSGISMNGKSCNIEAMSLGDDCYLLVTLSGKSRARSYKLKDGGCVCFCMGGSGDFLTAVKQLFRRGARCVKNSVYELDGEYFLIFDYPYVPRALRRVLSEYSRGRGGKIASARIKESGRLICGENAIQQIGRCL